jgi:hypothetical protein
MSLTSASVRGSASGSEAAAIVAVARVSPQRRAGKVDALREEGVVLQIQRHGINSPRRATAPPCTSVSTK